MIRIEPGQFYPEADVITYLGLSFNDLVRAREDGLQFKQLRRGRRVYKGQWLLDWLEQTERSTK